MRGDTVTVDFCADIQSRSENQKRVRQMGHWGLRLVRWCLIALLLPTAAMREALARDYEAMVGMVFGDTPPLDDVLQGIAALERTINA